MIEMNSIMMLVALKDEEERLDLIEEIKYKSLQNKFKKLEA